MSLVEKPSVMYTTSAPAEKFRRFWRFNVVFPPENRLAS